MRHFIHILLALALVFTVSGPANAGINDRFSDISLGDSGVTRNIVLIPAISTPSWTPENGWGGLYVKESGGTTTLYFEDDSGAVTTLTPTATAYDDIGNPDANSAIDFTTYTNTWTMAATAGDAFNIQGTGAFGDISVLRVEQVTGAATDGTVLEVVAADANVDPLVVSSSGKANAFVVGQNTGVVTIAGVAEGTDALVLTKGDINITDGDLTVTAGDASFAEDVSITGNLVGGTGLIDYTNFDVDAAGNVVAAGNVTAVDGTFSGNVSITGTFQQDALAAASADTTITLDGTGTGGVSIGTVSGTGTITMGGSATLVNLPATVDMTISGGDLAVTDTANADMVTFTNNTMTTADLLTLTAGGTRTSDNVIEIADSATTADTISITANAQTSGDGIYYANSGAALTGAALRMDITDGAGFTGYYILGYDGAANDFAVKRYGEVEIAGNAAADMLTVSAGDVQVDDGVIQVDVNEDRGNSFTRDFAGAGTAPTVTIDETNTASTNSALAINQDGTGASTAVSIVHDGDNPAIDISAGAARTGNVIHVAAANQTAEKIINIDGAWVGASGEGAIDIHTTGNLATDAALVRLDADTGTLVGATTGFMLDIDDDTPAQATSYAVEINSANNEALYVGAGQSTFVEYTTFQSGLLSNGIINYNFSVNTELLTTTTTPNDYAAGSGIFTLYDDSTGQTNASYMLRLAREADADAQDGFILLEDNSDGTAGNGDNMLAIEANGDIVMGGASGTGGKLVTSFEDLTIDNAGTAASVVTYTTFITTDGDGNEDNATLANGTKGQIKVFVISVEGAGADTWKITPASFNGGSKISFDGAVGDGCTLMYDGSAWNVISNNGGTIS